MKYADNTVRPNFLDLFDVGTKLNENCEWHFDIVLMLMIARMVSLYTLW